MRKAAIIALVAVGSSLAVYAGVSQKFASDQKNETACSDKTKCCPVSSKEACCK